MSDPNIARTLRRFLVDSRDNAINLLEEYTEYVENGEEPPDRLINELSAAAITYHDEMHPHIYDDLDGLKNKHELEEKVLESDQSTAEDPDLDAADFASWIREIDEQFYQLGFGRQIE